MPNGIASAFLIGADFIGDDDVALVLGDNIFYGVGLGEQLQQYTNPKGAVVFGLWVPDPERYGVLEFGPGGEVVAVHEKPADPPSSYMIPGLYFYDNSVVEVAGSIEPSARGELEISEVNNRYLQQGQLEVCKLPFSTEWFDVGTFDALLDAQTWVAGQQRRKGLLIGAPGDGRPPRGLHHQRRAAGAGRRRRPVGRPGQERLRRAAPPLPRVRGGLTAMPEIIDFDARPTAIDGLLLLTMKQVGRGSGHRPGVLPGVGLRGGRPARRSGPWRQVNVTHTRQGAVRGMHAEAMVKLVARGGRRGVRRLRRPAAAARAPTARSSPPRSRPGSRCSCPRASATGSRPPPRAAASTSTASTTSGRRAWPGMACTPLDPALGIDWPLPIDPDDPSQLSAKDRDAPLFSELGEERPVKLLVTGGAGFIGSNYVRYVLRETDDEVVVYDALTYAGNLSTLKDVDDDPRYSFVKGNICDPGTLEEAMAGVDAVVHFAAESHVDRSIIGSDDFVNTNCFGTNIVMDTARRLEIGRVVHIGTDEVYGSVETGSSKETDPLEPRSPYSASKAGSDLIALSYHHTHGVPVTVTRCTNNFGPYQYPEKAIPLFTTNLLDGGRIPLYGDGLNERDWLYVDDHCSGVHLVLHEGTAGEIYNIGAGNETPNRVLVDKLLALLGKDESSVEYVEDRLGHDRRYSVDIAKITALGWTKRRTLDEALAETVDWYRANEWWWRPLKSQALMHGDAGPHHRRQGAAGHRPRAHVPRRRRRRDRVRPDRARPHRSRLGARRPSPRTRPDVVLNAGAWTAVDACESDPDRAFRTNAMGCRWVTEAARLAGVARGAREHRLRVRRHQGRAVPRVGRPEPAGRCTAGRSSAASARPTRATRSCGRRGCAAPTVRTW